ncbi:MAG: hypothetical protein IPJ18_12625 [Betaproteobacteria bacterium]|nr:hypothetical protein [Betaproteobacteria bacterium]
MKNPFILPLLAVLSMCFCEFANADVYVIAGTQSPWSGLTQKDLLALYMGRSRSLDPGGFASVLDLPRSHPTRDEFYTALTGMSPAQVSSYWSRLIFAGKPLPPPTLPTEQLILEQVQRNPKAIGYQSKPPSDPSVKTLLVFKSP